MMYLGAGILLLVAYSGFAVVRTRDVTQQIIALGFYGLDHRVDVLLLSGSRRCTFTDHRGRGRASADGDARYLAHEVP